MDSLKCLYDARDALVLSYDNLYNEMKRQNGFMLWGAERELDEKAVEIKGMELKIERLERALNDLPKNQEMEQGAFGFVKAIPIDPDYCPF